MRIIRPLPALILALALLLQAQPGLAATGEDSGLPVPRFVSFKNDTTNIRTGPGVRYPISWVYHRDAFPVEIIEEFDQWRKVRDFEGTSGWVHKTLVDGRRTAIIRGGVRVMRHAPDDSAIPVLRSETGVIAQLIECRKDWCRIQIESQKGWIRKSHIWGAYAREEFEK